jgi:hypothetical protein
MRQIPNSDRSSGLVLAGVGILAIVGIGATLLTRTGQPAADPSTPSGVVTTYVRAIQSGDADRAWALLAPGAGQTTPEGPGHMFSQDSFRQQVQSSRQPTTPRVRILSVSQSADTASVQLEVSHASGNPLTGASTQQVALSLTRQAGGWRITADPMPWQFQ